MAQNITLLGASYSDVPAVQLPKTGGGTATFYDASNTETISSNGTYDVRYDASVVVNVSGGSVPYPTFDVTWDDNWSDIVAVTCDKTFAECAALTNGEDHRAVAYEHDQSQTYGYYTGGNNDTYRAQYIKYTFGQAGYDLLVNSNGTITWNCPSSDLVTAGTPTASKGSVSNHSVSVTPSVTNPYGYIVGGTITGSPVSVSASELVSGTLSITANGTHDVTNYASVNVNVSGGGGSSKNAQAHQSTTRTASTSYTSLNSFTCNKTGTYDVYWSCLRTSTSGTWGSQLYIEGTAYGSAQTGSWSNHVQNIHLTGVQIDQGETIEVRARSRGSNYYAYAPLLCIIEE